MTDTELAIWWVENILIPELPNNSTNATFHKSERLRKLIEDKYKHTMVFLPPYSPYLNPIEHKWHELKQRLRKYYDNSVDFMDNLVREIRVMFKFSMG